MMLAARLSVGDVHIDLIISTYLSGTTNSSPRDLPCLPSRWSQAGRRPKEWGAELAANDGWGQGADTRHPCG